MHDTAKRSSKTSRRTPEPEIINDAENSPAGDAAGRSLQFTRMRAYDDLGQTVRLSKAAWRHKVGGVETDGGTKMYAGTFEVITLDLANGPRAALAALGKIIDLFESHEALVLGVPNNGLLAGNITTEKRLKRIAEGDVPADTITRSLKDFSWPSGPGLLLLDADRCDNAWKLAIELYEQLVKVATLARPSASASIIHPQKREPLKRSEHTYALIDDPSMSKKVLYAFIRLCWCIGKGDAAGYPKITAAGSVLPYGLFDATVGSCERLSYEGAVTIIGDDLETLPRVSRLVGDGEGILCANAVIAFADKVAPEKEFRARFEAKKNEPTFAAEVAAIKAKHRAEHIAKQVKRGKSAEQAADEYDHGFIDLPSRLGNRYYGDQQLKQLPPGWELFKNGKPFTTDDIAHDPWAFHKTVCADPQEGMSYQSTTCGWIKFNGREVVITSKAHGDAFVYVVPIDLSQTVLGDLLRAACDRFGWVMEVPGSGPIAAPNWRERYASGLPKASLENARLAIQALGLICRYNEFSGQYIFDYKNEEIRSLLGDEIGDLSVIVLRQMLSATFGFDFTEKHVYDAARTLALACRFNPVVDLLAEAEANWDGVARLDRMAADHLNAEDTRLNSAFIRKTMIAGVARARTPGCKFDTITVLEGPQGWNKSTAWRVLAMCDEWFSDAKIIGKEGREVQEQLGAIWIHENADLAGMKKADVEIVKDFASRQADNARPAYGHFLKRQPRHSIEVGTTNATTYLMSQDGNRRFWPIKVLKEIDLDKLMRDRMQLWGEAAHYQSQGESLVLDRTLWKAAAVEQEARRVRDAWEDKLAQLPLVVKTDKGVSFGVVHRIDEQERVKTIDLLERVLIIQPAQQTTATAMRLATVMRVLGWKRPKNGYVKIDGRRVSGYFRPMKRLGGPSG
jgi:predicted P-loop ATPase